MPGLDIDKTQVVQNEADERFEIQLGDQVAILEYQRSGDQIIFPHTKVPTEYEGHGLGSKLAFAALEYAKQEKLKVVALCPYVAAYIRRHPEYQAITIKYGDKRRKKRHTKS